MSFLARTTFFRSSLTARPATRAFSLSARRTALSESDHHDDSDARKAKIDTHKEESLKQSKDGSGKWKKELASNSEAAVKADRDEIDATEENIAKLQEETTQAVAAEKKGK
ncbi:MAG: hypothetical protein MMC23_006361 [Stictis urceolatum]|nr:hypothetical protein [Stictis urceolata]